MVLSPSLAPVLEKLVTHIMAGNFLQMKELLEDNIALQQRVEETPSSCTSPWLSPPVLPQMSSITTPLQWIHVYWMLSILPNSVPILQLGISSPTCIYAKLVLLLAQKHRAGV